MRNPLLASFLIVIGCVDGPELDDPETVVEVTPPEVPPPEGVVPYVAGEQEQGRLLLGEYPDDLKNSEWHFHAGGSTSMDATLTISVRNANLIATRGGVTVYAGAHMSFVGMRFPASVGGELEVIGVTSVNPNITRYELVHHFLGSSEPYCAQGGAIPLKGRWTATGQHEGGDTISFACDDAVAFKCTDWGYVAGHVVGSVAWNHHQACTRMARADYCATGEPHTFEGTAIVIRDLLPGAMPNFDAMPLPHAPHPAPPDQFWFESAWQPTVPAAKCLSRVRWASMPLGGPCPGKIQDPRLDPAAKYCEDYAWDGGATTDLPLLFNASKVGQMYLHRWSTAAGQQLVTVRGWKDARGTERPYPAYVNYHGPVGLLMRNPPSGMPDLERVDLLLNSNTMDRYVGFNPLLPFTGYHSEGFEGFVYGSQGTPPRLPLSLYTNGTDRVTSTSAPPGFTKSTTLGYIDPP